jgi:hypothetical protein|tara:strand:- start:1520 stop:1726 length:207 start_codon:yes stop_codon:yes gene_type:complete
MEIAEYIKKHFLDSCSKNMHDLKHRREIIEVYKEQLKLLKDFIKIEDESLKKLENGIDKASKKSKTNN